MRTARCVLCRRRKPTRHLKPPLLGHPLMRACSDRSACDDEINAQTRRTRGRYRGHHDHWETVHQMTVMQEVYGADGLLFLLATRPT